MAAGPARQRGDRLTLWDEAVASRRVAAPRQVRYRRAMKLFYTPTSPFVRKVRVVAHELGGPLTLELLRPSPMTPDPVLSRQNPLSKIPALVLDDGTTLYDSPVICEYLDTLANGGLVPAQGMERWQVLRRQALADGILDAGILVFYERSQRPVELHWESWIAGQTAKVNQGLDALELEVAGFGQALDLGQISCAATLGWLDFRQPVGDFRATRPALAEWYQRFLMRPSMQATLPG